MPQQILREIRVRPLPDLEERKEHRRAIVLAGSRVFRCVVGRSGVAAKQGEGDGVTPVGRFALRQGLVRRDRNRFVRSALPLTAIVPGLRWCDAPFDRNYNRLVQGAYSGHCEDLYREDRVYDVVVVVGFNDCPRVQGRGSAIFIHATRPDLRPTEGCLAFNPRDLRQLVGMIGPRTSLLIES